MIWGVIDYQRTVYGKRLAKWGAGSRKLLSAAKFRPSNCLALTRGGFMLMVIKYGYLDVLITKFVHHFSS